MARLWAALILTTALLQFGCASNKKEEAKPAENTQEPAKQEVAMNPTDANTAPTAEGTTGKTEEPPKSQNLDQLTSSILQEAQKAVENTKKEQIANMEPEGKDEAKPRVGKKSMTGATAKSGKDKFYFVQLASYARKQDAIKLADTLKSGKVEPLIDVAELEGKTFHRVILGAFETRAEAEEYLKNENLNAKFKDAFVRKANKSELNLFKVE